ncbi:MAG: hypothetical protein GY765_44060 [bacterium]|nr:hypothetical protein [bacterium]
MAEDLDGILDDILSKEKRAAMEQEVEQYTMKQKAPMLELLSDIYKIMAYICGGIFAILAVIGVFSLFGDMPKGPIFRGIIHSLLIGAVSVVTGLAVSEGIKLFIRIEANSRKQVLLLSKLVNKESKADK